MKKGIASFLAVGAFICILTACANTTSTFEPPVTESEGVQEELQQEETTSSSAEEATGGLLLIESAVPTEPDNEGNRDMPTEATAQYKTGVAAADTAGEAMINQPTNDLGALSPEDALEYMKNTPDLIIVDVAATRWYDEEHFENAINIPIEELTDEEEDARYMEIPAGHPVLLHCRKGMIVPGAYERVKELRSDIPEISYIDDTPPFAQYNEWLTN